MTRYSTGIDIGNLHLRAVCLSHKGGQSRVQAAATVTRFDANGERKPLALALAELERACPFKGRIILATSDAQVLVRYIPAVPMAEDRVQRLLRLELSQHNSEDGDLAADTFVVPLAGEELIHCCCIAQAKQLCEILDELAQADCRPSSVHLQSAALANVFSCAPPLEGDAYALVVDMGAKSTRVGLRRGDELLACRELPLGGDSFTETLAKERSIPFAQAEGLKLSGLALPSGSDGIRQLPGPGDFQAPKQVDEINWDWLEEGQQEEAEAQAQDASDTELKLEADETQDQPAEADALVNREEPSWLRHEHAPAPQAELQDPGSQTVTFARESLGPELSRAAETFIGQISSSLAWFRAQLKLRDCQLSRIDCCGGGSQLEGLLPYMERRMHCPVGILNPFFSLEGQLPERPECFAAALGLARAALPGSLDLDVRPESLRIREIWRQRILWRYLSAVVLLCAAIALAWGMRLNQNYYNRRLEAYAEHERSHQAYREQIDILSQRRDQLTEDVRGIAARIFAGRDLLYVIRSLKEAAEVHHELWVAEFRTEGVSQDHSEQQAAPATTRGRARGSDRDRRSSPRPAHADTSIDRGQLFVRVVILRDQGREAQRYERIFRDWLHSVMRWQRPDDGGALFRDYDLTEVPNLPDRHEYEVRFEFMPTLLQGEELEEAP